MELPPDKGYHPDVPHPPPATVSIGGLRTGNEPLVSSLLQGRNSSQDRIQDVIRRYELLKGNESDPEFHREARARTILRNRDLAKTEQGRKRRGLVPTRISLQLHSAQEKLRRLTGKGLESTTVEEPEPLQTQPVVEYGEGINPNPPVAVQTPLNPKEAKLLRMEALRQKRAENAAEKAKAALARSEQLAKGTLPTSEELAAEIANMNNNNNSFGFENPTRFEPIVISDDEQIPFSYPSQQINYDLDNTYQPTYERDEEDFSGVEVPPPPEEEQSFTAPSEQRRRNKEEMEAMDTSGGTIAQQQPFPTQQRGYNPNNNSRGQFGGGYNQGGGGGGNRGPIITARGLPAYFSKYPRVDKSGTPMGQVSFQPPKKHVKGGERPKFTKQNVKQYLDKAKEARAVYAGLAIEADKIMHPNRPIKVNSKTGKQYASKSGRNFIKFLKQRGYNYKNMANVNFRQALGNQKVITARTRYSGYRDNRPANRKSKR